MPGFAETLRACWDARPFVWLDGPAGPEDPAPPRASKVLALAPHPDDPESAAVTLRLLAEAGCAVRYAVACLSPRGVEDDYARAHGATGGGDLDDRKAALRRREQLAAAREAGLDEGAVTFLGLDEGDRLDSEPNVARVVACLEREDADVVVLPAGHDENRTHAWLHRVFHGTASALAEARGRPVVGFYNEDPKTTRLRDDLYVCFGEERARWKGRLLRIHDSQQQRSARSRGHGFDDRILGVNRRAMERLLRRGPAPPGAFEHAEAFEIETFMPREGAGP